MFSEARHCSPLMLVLRNKRTGSGVISRSPTVHRSFHVYLREESPLCIKLGMVSNRTSHCLIRVTWQATAACTRTCGTRLSEAENFITCRQQINRNRVIKKNKRESDNILNPLSLCSSTQTRHIPHLNRAASAANWGLYNKRLVSG